MEKRQRAVLEIASWTKIGKSHGSYNKCGDIQPNFTVLEVFLELRLGCRSGAYLSGLMVTSYPTSEELSMKSSLDYLHFFKDKIMVFFSLLNEQWLEGRLWLWLWWTMGRRKYHLGESPKPVGKPFGVVEICTQRENPATCYSL